MVRRDRAQLIVLGCIALAFIIISLGLLINTTIYTESSSQALSNAQIDSATSLDLETRRGTRSLIHRSNLGPRDRSERAFNDNVTGTVDNYSSLLAQHYARTDAAAVDVDYNPDGSRIGTRVVQEEDGDYYDEFVLDDDHRIGWFALNVNVSETSEGSTSPFELTIENETGEELDVEIYKNTSTVGTEPNLTIQTELAGSSWRNQTFNPRDNRVVLDVVSGEVIADKPADPDPLYSISDLGSNVSSISVSGANEFDGSWEFVTNRSYGSGFIDESPSGPDLQACTAPPPSDEACRTPAVWTANVTTTFDGDGITFHRNRNVTIYGGDR